MTLELRFSMKLAPELRSGSATPSLTGYGATFMRYSQNLGGFVEQIAPGAFDESIRNGQEIRSMYNHRLLLGDLTSGTLALEVDSVGLRYTVDVPDTSYGRDLVALVQSKRVRGSSFAFQTLEDTWSLTDQGFPLRTLVKASVRETGPVDDPAYLSTEETGAAVALRSLSELISCPLDELVAAAGRNELRSYLPGGSVLPPKTDEDDEARNAAVLASQRARRERTLRLLAVR
jgi:uncharacterized protein